MTTINWESERKKLFGDDGENEYLLPPEISLPAMPIAVTEFCRMAESPDACPRELAKVVESDAGLTCELLKYVNSSAFGLRMEVASIQHAITRLGIRQVKLFLMTSGVKNALSSRQSKLINLENFWVANLERALFAKELAKLLGADGEIAFAAAMVQDILLPILSNEQFDDYLAFSNNQNDAPQLITNFERCQFQWDHASAAANIVHAWSFPDEIVCCVYMHHAGLKIMTDKIFRKTSVGATALASLIPDAIRQVPNGIHQLMQLEEIWESFNLLKVAERVNEQFEELAPNLSNHFSLLKRVEKQLIAV